MKRLEAYISVARSFNAGLKVNSDLKVVEKPKNNDGNEGLAEYVFNDGVIIRHSWDGGTYGFGYKDYDHSIEVVSDGGYEFEQKSLSYFMKKSKRL